MQNLLDFINKYKKYIAAAVVLTVFIIVLVVTNGGSKKSNQDPSEAVTQSTDAKEVSAENFEFDSQFQENKEDAVSELIGKYYSAYAGYDENGLEKLAKPLSENEKSYIEVLSKYYDEITDIKCYSKKGLTEGSYFVSTSYKIKFKDIKTKAPALDFFYVETDENGELFINNLYSVYNLSFMEETLDPDVYSLVQQYMQQSDFASIQKDVQADYDKAMKKDKKLAKMMQTTLDKAVKEWASNVKSGDSTEQTTDDSKKDNTEKKDDSTEKKDESKKDDSTEKKDESKKDESKKKDDSKKKDESKKKDDSKKKDESKKKDDSKKKDESKKKDNSKKKDESKKNKSKKEVSYVKTRDIVNVRKKPSTDAEALGRLTKGVKLTKLGEKGEWSIVKYNGGKGYVKTEFLKAIK